MPEGDLAFKLGKYAESLRRAADDNEKMLRTERAGLPGTSEKIQAQLEERAHMQRTIAQEIDSWFSCERTER